MCPVTLWREIQCTVLPKVASLWDSFLEEKYVRLLNTFLDMVLWRTELDSENSCFLVPTVATSALGQVSCLRHCGSSHTHLGPRQWGIIREAREEGREILRRVGNRTAFPLPARTPALPGPLLVKTNATTSLLKTNLSSVSATSELSNSGHLHSKEIIKYLDSWAVIMR